MNMTVGCIIVMIVIMIVSGKRSYFLSIWCSLSAPV